MLNLNILGHPINLLTVVLIIVLFWVALFALHKTGVIPSHADGGAAS